MHILQVFLKVRPEQEERFLEISRYNAEHSRLEPGVVRFDLLASAEHPNEFSLWEVYRSQADVDAHKQTEHYKRWVEAMEVCLTESRTRTLWRNVDPTDEVYR